MRKGGLWKKTVSILLASAMVLTAVPVSASGFEADESRRVQGKMEEVLMEGKTDKEEMPGTKDGFQAEEVPEAAVFEAEAPESVKGFAAERDVLGDENPAEKVASIGANEYATLAEAIAAVRENDETTIKLLDNTVEAVTIPKGKEIVLDLNGWTLRNNEEPQDKKTEEALRKHTITNLGDLTITDGTVEKFGTVDNVSHGRAAVCNGREGNLWITGGDLTRSIDAEQSLESDGGNSGNVILNQGQLWDISDGYIYSEGYHGSLIYNEGGSRSASAKTYFITGGTFEHNAVIIDNNEYGWIDKIEGGTFCGTLIANADASFAVTGGTFDSLAQKTVRAYLPPGYGLDPNGEVSKHVAMLRSEEDQKYETLQEAVSAFAAVEGHQDYYGQITLIGNTEETVTIPADIMLDLDLNGCTLKYDGTSAGTIVNSGYLHIYDSSEEGNGTVENGSEASSAIANQPGGWLVLDGGRYTHSTNPIGFAIVNQGSMSVSDGVEITKEDLDASLIWNFRPVASEYEAELSIYGGTFSGGLYTLDNGTGGKLFIYGGSFTNDSRPIVRNGNELKIEGGTFEGLTGVVTGSNNEDVKANTIIAGGDFTTTDDVLVIDEENSENATYEVSGGIYHKEIDKAFVIPGYKQGGEPKYEVTKKDYEVDFIVVGEDGAAVSGVVIPTQTVGYGKTVAKPYFSPTGYRVAGWYANSDCSTKWNFAAPVTDPATIYVKIVPTNDEQLDTDITAAIGKFDKYCKDSPGVLSGKTLADLTGAALTDEVIAALKKDNAKKAIKDLIEAVDAAGSPEDLERYLASDSTRKKEIDNLRAIQNIVFPVETMPTRVQDEVIASAVSPPEVPANVRPEQADEIRTRIEELMKDGAVRQTVEDVFNSAAACKLPPEGLEAAAGSEVTEPSILFIGAVLKDIALEAVVKQRENGYDVSLVPQKLIFDVAPYKQRAKVDTDGTILGADPSASQIRIPNEKLTKPVVIYLPVPYIVEKDYAKVYHDKELLGHYRIQKDKWNNKYVGFTADSFSLYTLEFTDDSGYVPPAVSYYNVTFDSRGGSAVPAINSVREYSTIAQPADPTKENFVFGGWFKDAECKEAWDFARDTVTGDLTLYAKWTEDPASMLDPVAVKVDSRTTSTVKISWSESAKAEGYTVWAKEEGQTSYKRVAIVSKDAARTYTWKKREPGTKHFFVVKAWIKDENGKYVFSEASKTVRGTTKPETAKIKKVTVNAAGDLKVTLEGPAKGANRYAMCWSRKADFSSYAIGIRTQYTTRTMVKGLKPGTCYVKVRSYRQMGGSRVYGDWSDAVTAVVEKSAH